MAKNGTPPQNPADKPEAKPVLMRPAPRGGMLRVGGTNKGGTGRPRDAVRATMLDGLNAALPRLLELTKHEDPAIALKASDLLAKYGLGTSNELDTTVSDKRVLTREEREHRALELLKPGKVG